VVSWKIYFTPQAQKDAKKLAKSGLRKNAEELLAVIAKDPFANPPRFEKLVGDLAGACSRRINIQHRIVYQVLKKERAVKILRMWTHYE
jgi:toxin YoeB